jgi:hypothetical protein
MVAGSYALRWNGTSWKLTGAPFGDQGSTIPTGSVSCPALGRCEAVGMTGPFPSSTASDNLAGQYVG